jgi:hypothetical protein
MVTAALIAFVVLLVAWLVAPVDGRATAHDHASSAREPEPMPHAA